MTEFRYMRGAVYILENIEVQRVPIRVMADVVEARCAGSAEEKRRNVFKMIRQAKQE